MRILFFNLSQCGKALRYLHSFVTKYQSGWSFLWLPALFQSHFSAILSRLSNVPKEPNLTGIFNYDAKEAAVALPSRRQIGNQMSFPPLFATSPMGNFFYLCNSQIAEQRQSIHWALAQWVSTTYVSDMQRSTWICICQVPVVVMSSQKFRTLFQSLNSFNRHISSDFV